MKPHNITVKWIDYNPTASDDMYEVIFEDWSGETHSCKVTGDAVGIVIAQYMQKSKTSCS